MRSVAHVAIAAALLLTAPAIAAPRAKGSVSSHRSSQVSLRKKLHVNDLITEPGTAEIDWASLYSYTTGNFTMPSAVRYTPLGNSIFWGRTEYSVSFDSIESAINTPNGSTQFSDRLTFAATSVVFDSPHFDIAVAPSATVFLHGDSGMRMGATTIARYDGPQNDFGFSTGWTAATTPSDTNPAGTWDFGTGYGRKLAISGPWSNFTPHVNVVLEKSTGFDRTLAGFAGVEYQVTERVAVDASGQRLGLIGGGADRQIVVGMTINLGKGH